MSPKRSDNGEVGWTRRNFLGASGTLTAAVLTGCASATDSAPSGTGGSAGFGGGAGAGGSGGVAGAGGAGAADGGAQDAGTLPGQPQWSHVPDQIWAVGVPVFLDLRQYCSDPDGAELTFSLSKALPPGVSLVDGVISGTPTAIAAPTEYEATADDA